MTNTNLINPLISNRPFWNSDSIGNPPLTDELLSKAEQLLNVRLPLELIELLRVQNGGYTSGFVYPTSVPTSGFKNHVPFAEMFGIVDTAFEAPINILSTEYLTEEWSLPVKQVLLCGEGHWWITLDYRTSETPSVALVDVEEDEDIQLAGSFREFLAGLVPEDDYA